MSKYYNWGNGDLKYEVKDLNIFKRINRKTRRPSKKLYNKLYRPFQVQKVITLIVI
jgi:hypothetical protein